VARNTAGLAERPGISEIDLGFDRAAGVIELPVFAVLTRTEAARRYRRSLNSS
jgi:hypothetical protein